MILLGQQGVHIAVSGFEAALKIDKVTFRNTAGNMRISASGDKSKLEAYRVSFYTKNETAIILSGNETSIKLNETSFFGQ